ncbi:MAG: hypothetical protein DMG88_23205 [Acidobacteria bacterium]|nr:MAG: hypothetical protein DMG88_23205 [Acidobacteriota bacterium]
MCQYAGHGPGSAGVLGGKGIAAGKEFPRVAAEWPTPPGNGPDHKRFRGAVGKRFAGQQSGFAEMLIAPQVPPEKRSPRSAQQGVG